MLANNQKLILASSSPYRKSLLNKLQIPFICESPDIDESKLSNETPKQLVERLSIDKAKAVADKYIGEDYLVIGSDQVAALNENILTKPGNFDNAVTQLRLCSNKTVEFYTGLCLYSSKTQQYQSCVEPFSVVFRDLTLEEIEDYIKADKPYDCAGSFKAEELGITLFEKMIGDDPNSLIGLPLIQLTNMLKNQNNTRQC